MLKANERRQKILEILCVRRQETMENLAQEFNVTTRTIRNDIEELTLAHPIETVRGRYGGGVRVRSPLLASNSGKIYVTILRKNHRAKLCILAFAGQDEVCIF